MIVKKPYAFLIKNFRIIHALLFVMLVYLGIKSLDIYTFFNMYATKFVYTYAADLAVKYVNYYMFIVDILAILVSLLIYYIMSLKNKERKLYIFTCLYYILLFIYFIFIYNTLSNIQINSLNIEQVRTIRDISLIVLIPQVIMTFIHLGRACGFNLKQFDFKKDLEELQIDTSDYEEVELTLGKNNYKIARFFRKALRLAKYYILEHKFVVTVCTSVVVLITTLVIFLNMRVYQERYRENQEILASTLWYTAQEAYITDSDISGNKIQKDKYYVLIRTKIDNKSANTYKLTRETFRLVVNGEMLIPKFSYKNEFLDIGEVFAPMDVPAGETKDVVIVYEIDKDDVRKEYILKIKNYDNLVIGNIASPYKEIIIKPYDLNSKNDTGTYSLPAELDFNNTVLGKSSLILGENSISSTFKENYKYCSDETTCYEGTYIVRPESTGRGSVTVLKLKTTAYIDNSISFSKYLNYPRDIIKYYGKIRYKANGIIKTIVPEIINTKYQKDTYTYLEVPKEIELAEKIELIITIRGIKYTIVLK